MLTKASKRLLARLHSIAVKTSDYTVGGVPANVWLDDIDAIEAEVRVPLETEIIELRESLLDLGLRYQRLLDDDLHSVDDQHPCFICGRIVSHDHSTIEWNACLEQLKVDAERLRIVFADALIEAAAERIHTDRTDFLRHAARLAVAALAAPSEP